MRRVPTIGLIVALATAPVVACGGDDTSGETLPTLAASTTAVAASEAPLATDAPSTEAPSETEAPPATEAPTTDTAAGNGTPTFVIEAEAEGGQPVGGVRSYLVEVGQTVEITVTADTADEAHLHGYDLDADLEPGVPTIITFTADMAGSFEMELHESGALLFYLDVV